MSDYEHAHRKAREARQLEQHYTRGFEALRQDLMAVFQRIGKAELNGYTALEIVKNAKLDVPRATLGVTR
jgi:hypothetical protein